MADDHHVTTRERAHDAAHTMRIAIATLLLVALVAFALANTDDTNVDYLAGDTDAPLVAVLLGAAVVGALITALVRRRHR